MKIQDIKQANAHQTCQLLSLVDQDCLKTCESINLSHMTLIASDNPSDRAKQNKLLYF